MKLPFLLTLALLVAPIYAEPAAEPSCCAEEEAAAEAAGSVYQLDGRWTDQHNKSVALADFKGKPILLTMGYASCKFACPRLAADLMAIERELTPEQKEQVSFFFVSIDPENDTPEKLAEFLGQYKVDQSRWFGLRGSADDVLELSVAIGTRYRAIENGDFAHSNRISLISADGVILHTQEGLGTDPKDMVAALGETLSAAKKAE